MQCDIGKKFQTKRYNFQPVEFAMFILLGEKREAYSQMYKDI